MMAQKMEIHTGTYMRSLSILHLAMLAGQVIFVLVALFLQTTQAIKTTALTPEIDSVLRYIIPALAAGSIIAGSFLFRQKTAALKMLPASAEKYNGYRSACILRYAIMEAPSMVAVVVFILSGNYYYLAVSGVVIIAFIIIRPSLTALTRHLQPSIEEQAALESPEAVLYEDRFAGQ